MFFAFLKFIKCFKTCKKLLQSKRHLGVPTTVADRRKPPPQHTKQSTLAQIRGDNKSENTKALTQNRKVRYLWSTRILIKCTSLTIFIGGQYANVSILMHGILDMICGCVLHLMLVICPCNLPFYIAIYAIIFTLTYFLLYVCFLRYSVHWNNLLDVRLWPFVSK